MRKIKFCCFNWESGIFLNGRQTHLPFKDLGGSKCLGSPLDQWQMKRHVTYLRWGNPKGSQECLPSLPVSLPLAPMCTPLGHFPDKVLSLKALGSAVGGSKPRKHSIISPSSWTTPAGRQKMGRDWSKSQDLEPGEGSLALDSLHPPRGLLMSEELLGSEKNGTKAKGPRAWESSRLTRMTCAPSTCPGPGWRSRRWTGSGPGQEGVSKQSLAAHSCQCSGWGERHEGQHQSWQGP